MDNPFAEDAPWELHEMEMRVLGAQPTGGFDCGRDEQNRFLYQRAWRDQKRGVSATHLLSIKGIPAAFVTLVMDRIILGLEERPKGVSYRFVGGMKIAQLAVDRRFAGYGLGRFMVGYAVQFARTLRPRVGCRLLTLDAEPRLVGWYEGMGFVPNAAEQEHRRQLAIEAGRPVEEIPVSMRFDLRDATEHGPPAVASLQAHRLPGAALP